MRLSHPVFVSLLLMCQLVAHADSDCPRTQGTARLGDPFPEAGDWYGNEALAVPLSQDELWPITAPNAVIAIKLFWFSAGFEPGMEANLSVKITDLNGKPSNAVVGRPTNAQFQSGHWAMLTGIDFPDPGCWRITGMFLGQTLTFVVETVGNEEYQKTMELRDRP